MKTFKLKFVCMQMIQMMQMMMADLRSLDCVSGVTKTLKRSEMFIGYIF